MLVTHLRIFCEEVGPEVGFDRVLSDSLSDIGPRPPFPHESLCTRQYFVPSFAINRPNGDHVLVGGVFMLEACELRTAVLDKLASLPLFKRVFELNQRQYMLKTNQVRDLQQQVPELRHPEDILCRRPGRSSVRRPDGRRAP